MAIKIEKNIPLMGNDENRNSYPFSSMEVGDSFVVNSEKERNSVWNCYHLFRSKEGNTGYKISTRKIEDGKYRIWRTK